MYVLKEKEKDERNPTVVALPNRIRVVYKASL